MAGNVEWPSEKTKIVCEIFAEQVEKGNRSSTHLNKVGYANVIAKFHERTGLLYPKLKFKNKWDKLKREYEAWKKLKKQTGLGWDEKKGTVTCDDDRWKKLKKDIKGCSKFEHQGLQNEEKLRIMFEDLRNTGADHWEASSGAAPGSPQESDGAAEEEDGDEEETDEEVTPPPAKGKRARGSVKDKGKKPKTSGREWLEEQMSQIMVMNERTTASCESMARKEDRSGFSIKDVMALVKECGAVPGTEEHFIASELFTKSSEREMFMTLETPQERFEWLKKKYSVKYGNN